MSSSTAPKTILLRGDPVPLEAPAATSTIVPGMLLERTSAGTVRPHRNEGSNIGRASRLFAKEADYLGADIDDAYATSDRVPFYSCRPGDAVYALLEVGANVAAGTFLQSNGAGSLEAVDSDGIMVAQALEAVNNSAGSVPARIKVEVV